MTEDISKIDTPITHIDDRFATHKGSNVDADAGRIAQTMGILGALARISGDLKSNEEGGAQ